VEVSIALGVAGFCLLAVLGLLQTGLASEKVTVGQTVASDLLSLVYSDLASAAVTNTKTDVFGISLDGQNGNSPQTIYFTSGGMPTGSPIVGSAPTADSQYRVSVGIKSPAANSKMPALTRILVTWPAVADPVPAQWPTNQAGSVEVLTTLNRN
jgi:hypothetical protein